MVCYLTSVCFMYSYCSNITRFAVRLYNIVNFAEISSYFPAFCSLLLCSYYSKYFAGKIGASLLHNCVEMARHVTPATVANSLSVHNLSHD